MNATDSQKMRTDTELLHFSANDVQRTFRGSGNSVSALRSINFSIERGEQVAIIGPSGAGKTTLIRILSLAIPASDGCLNINGEPAQRLGEAALRRLRRQIGVVYQQHNLVRRLPVLQNVLAGKLGQWSFLHAARTLIRPTPEEIRLALQALDHVDLMDKALERPSALSGGQQQRVAIARVLAQAPQAILADEPVSSLDPGLAKEIIELLVDLSKRFGTTLISSLHNVELALKYFPRIIGMRDGKIRFDRTTRLLDQEELEKLYARNHLDDESQVRGS